MKFNVCVEMIRTHAHTQQDYILAQVVQTYTITLSIWRTGYTIHVRPAARARVLSCRLLGAVQSDEHVRPPPTHIRYHIGRINT